jgi:hypothetical protein
MILLDKISTIGKPSSTGMFVNGKLQRPSAENVSISDAKYPPMAKPVVPGSIQP